MPSLDVLTVLELAAVLRVGRNTVYEFAEQGQIPGTLRPGLCLRFHDPP